VNRIAKKNRDEGDTRLAKIIADCRSFHQNGPVTIPWGLYQAHPGNYLVYGLWSHPVSINALERLQNTSCATFPGSTEKAPSISRKIILHRTKLPRPPARKGQFSSIALSSIMFCSEPFRIRPSHSVQTYPISRNPRTLAPRKSYAGGCSPLPEVPCILLCSRGLPEREKQPRDHHRKKPSMRFKIDWFGGDRMVRRTRRSHWPTENDPVSKREGGVLLPLTLRGVVGLKTIKVSARGKKIG